jgi:hypothetical protein
MGRSQIRDYSDAVNSLNDARNALTQALSDHRIGEYELSRDVGLIALGPEGIVPKFRPDPRPAQAQVNGAAAPAPASHDPPDQTNDKKSDEGSKG